MLNAQPIHPNEERLFLGACLAHLKRADGGQAKDWSLAETAHRGAAELLTKYLASPGCPMRSQTGPTPPWRTCAQARPRTATGRRPRPKPSECYPLPCRCCTCWRLPRAVFRFVDMARPVQPHGTLTGRSRFT